MQKVVNLIVDIGNTVAKLAVFESNELKEVAYTSNETLSGLKDFYEKYPIKKCIVSSVVDVKDEARNNLKLLDIPVVEMNHELKLPVKNLYSTPETLGSDRIAGIVGANYYYPENDILVIDAGTCITYDFIDSSNSYLGGNISPGIDMRFKSLNAFTSRLPLLDNGGDCPLIGYNTETAIRAGVIRGVEFEVLGYISEMRSKYPRLLVFLTGGYSFSFEISSKNRIFADKFLVLKGLNRLLEYNEVK